MTNNDNQFCKLAKRLGILSKEQIEKAFEEQKVDNAIGVDQPIHTYLLKANAINQQQVDEILEQQKQKKCFFAAIGLLCVLLFYSAFLSSPAPKHVLILTIGDESGFDIDDFNKALRNGGHTEITARKIADKYPDFQEKYTIIDDEGKYLVVGPIINFVVDKGWHFHSCDSNNLFFIKH